MMEYYQEHVNRKAASSYVYQKEEKYTDESAALYKVFMETRVKHDTRIIKLYTRYIRRSPDCFHKNNNKQST